jgi:hypothetical protein
MKIQISEEEGREEAHQGVPESSRAVPVSRVLIDFSTHFLCARAATTRPRALMTNASSTTTIISKSEYFPLLSVDFSHRPATSGQPILHMSFI